MFRFSKFTGEDVLGSTFWDSRSAHHETPTAVRSVQNLFLRACYLLQIPKMQFGRNAAQAVFRLLPSTYKRFHFFLQYKPRIELPADTNGPDKLLIIIFSGLGSLFVLGLMVSALCYFCYWKKRQKTDANESVGGWLFQ